jgi:NAD(P)-dependent dehydrogenase (short-subunit alcohol dehydrogenase family)
VAEAQWAVILGASVGTGAAIARAVAREPGLHVFGAHRGRHADDAGGVVADIEAAGRRAVFRVGDAGTVDGVSAAVAELAAALDGERVKLFVHSLASASLGRFTSDRPLTATQVHKTFDVMAHSFLFWVQALVARDLLAPGARIVALTNPLDESLLVDCGLIAATKASLQAYVKSLALELGPRGHRVNLLKFSTVITPAMRVVYGEDALAHVERVHARMLPAGRMCTVEEVARVVRFLVSDQAEFFNGATIDYSGGMTLGLAELLLGREG